MARTLTGALTVTSVSISERATKDGCSLLSSSAAAGFDDVGPGAQVTVTDEAGTIVATSQLGPGRFVGTHTEQQADYSAIGDSPEMPEYDVDADSQAELDAYDAAMEEWRVANDAWTDAFDAAPMVDVTFGNCVFDFTVPELADAAFLSIEVSHRGKVTYSRADLQANDWTVGLSL
ncbi:hypothetical protein [Cellulomonas sp. URHB0016]